MNDDQKSSKTKLKTAPVKPMAALQGYLDDMLAVATEAVTETEVISEPYQTPEAPAPEITASEPIEPVQVKPEHSSKTQVVSRVAEKSVEVTETSFREKVITESPVIAIPDVVEPEIETTEVIAPQVIAPKVEAPKIEVPKVEVPPTPEVIVEKTTIEAPIELAQAVEVLEPLKVKKSAYPDWASAGFECLLFYVGGIKLAVPLVLLGGIYRIDKDLTPLFGQPDWFLGLYPRNTMDGQQNLRVVHTSRWVMPEKKTPDLDPINHYVISLGDSEWGLLSHQLSDSIRLMPDQVKWRTETSKRPWLAGTVIDHMCAILDVTSMVTLLNQKSKRIN